MDRIAWLVGILLTLYGLWKGYDMYRTKKNSKLAEDMKNRDLLLAIHKELHPNGGASLADKINRIEFGVHNNRERIDAFMTEHNAQLKEIAKENREEHAHIHDRVDGILSLFVNSDAVADKRIARRHRESREEEQ